MPLPRYLAHRHDHHRYQKASHGDTAKELVSPFQGDPEFIIPLDGRDGYLRVGKKGHSRRVELDGEPVGELLRATNREPWHEFAFEREGHSFVVASFYTFMGLARPNASSPIEVFADGVNLHDGRHLDEWRLHAPLAGSMPLIGTRPGIERLPNVPGLPVLVRYWVVAAVFGVVIGVFRGDLRLIPATAAGWGVATAWFELIHLAQGWALRRSDLGVGARLSVVMAALAVPVLAPLLVLGLFKVAR